VGQRKYKVLLISSHPVQYASPLFRQMAQHPRLDIQVAYCSLQGAEAGVDPEFGVEVKWDIPLLEGYPWVHVPNRSPRPGLGRFFGLINPGLWKLVTRGDYDAVVLYTGYLYASFWIAVAAAKLRRVPILFGTDAVDLVPLDGQKWKVGVKRFLWPRLFRLASVVNVPSTGSVALMKSLGIPDERLVLTPYVVDNDWWTREAKTVDRGAVRHALGIPEAAPVVLFCAKLQPWKRPLDLLQAFAKANVPGSHLVYAGEGPLRRELESGAISLGLAERVHFLGFTNQSQLPAVYRASDLLVLPSKYDAFGVVVNEAMLCGCSAVVSDRVGAGRDLISAGENGYIFPFGDVGALAAILREVLPDRSRIGKLGSAARDRMRNWSPREHIEAFVHGVNQAAKRRGRQVHSVVY
jgi:glycosyltransferase involved in cell wall biosynthesis